MHGVPYSAWFSERPSAEHAEYRYAVQSVPQPGGRGHVSQYGCWIVGADALHKLPQHDPWIQPQPGFSQITAQDRALQPHPGARPESSQRSGPGFRCGEVLTSEASCEEDMLVYLAVPKAAPSPKGPAYRRQHWDWCFIDGHGRRSRSDRRPFRSGSYNGHTTCCAEWLYTPRDHRRGWAHSQRYRQRVYVRHADQYSVRAPRAWRDLCAACAPWHAAYACRLPQCLQQRVRWRSEQLRQAGLLQRQAL